MSVCVALLEELAGVVSAYNPMTLIAGAADVAFVVIAVAEARALY